MKRRWEACRLKGFVAERGGIVLIRMKRVGKNIMTM